MATAGQLQCRIITQAILLIIFVGVVAWLLGAYGAFASAIACVVEQWYVIKSITQGNAGKQLQASLSQVPQVLITGLESVGQLIWGLVIPAVIVWLCQIALMISAFKEKKSRGFGSCCNKCLIFMVVIFGLVCFVLYLLVGGIGAVSQSPEAQMQIQSFRSWCNNELPETEKELRQSEALVATLSTLAPDHPDVKAAQVEVDSARRAVDALTALCVCTESLWAALAGLAAAGFVSAIVALIVIIANCCTCCQMGCCCRSDDQDKDKGVTMQGVQGIPMQSGV